MIRGILLSVLLLCLPTWAQAATYYINDAGADANAGTSTGSPWLTWAYAFSHSKCGDRLIVMDGTYTKATHGNFSLTKVCTAGTVYTVIAQNERAAFINNSDGTQGLIVLNSAYITVQGIRIKSTDEIVAAPNSIVDVRDSNHITFRRLLVTHNNRYYNTHLLQLTRSPFSLVEESEFYFFHRHAILSYYSDDSVIRRNYCHARDYADIAGGWVSAPSATGDDCIVVYPGNRNIVENNIAEGSMLKMGGVEATASSVGNKFLGNIAKGTIHGIMIDARGTKAELMPKDTLIRDFVALDTIDLGVVANATKNTHCDHCYVFSSEGGAFSASYQTTHEGDGVYSFFVDNSMANANREYGFRINSAVGTWTIRTSNSFGNTPNYTLATSTNYSPNPPRAVDPVMGMCRVWVPDGSPMKRAGSDGSDIGANILYRYNNGVLTNVPLWNPTTGEFPHGALVAGVNDVAGKSLFDVHKRLNVNTNGCSFPANYGAGGTDVDSPATPTNLTVF